MTDGYSMRTPGDGTRVDGDVVRIIRQRQTRSLRAVAGQVGISPGELSKIETGARAWTHPYIVTKLAAVLLVPACVIVTVTT